MVSRGYGSYDGIDIQTDNGNGTFSLEHTYTSGFGNLYTLTIGDFNSDGNIDIVSGQDGATSGFFLFGNGDASFQALRSFSTGVDDAAQWATGDFTIWNAFPGNIPIKKFKDRQTAVQRLWAAFERLPVEPAAKPGRSGVRADWKQARVITLLRRPEGATIDEMASAMGWQRQIPYHDIAILVLPKEVGLATRRLHYG